MSTIPKPPDLTEAPFTEKIAPHQAAYDDWKATPDDTRKLDAVIKQLNPTINGVLRSLGNDGDAALTLKAKVLTSRAIRTYDPQYGAALPTWVARQLQPLRRYKRTALMPVRVPERMQLEAVTIMQAENEFREKHDRDPDMVELSDAVKMPAARIADIRRTFRRVASASSFGENSAQDQPSTDFSDEALEYIYPNADLIDKRIIEMKTGYGGSFEPMAPHVIAQRLNLTPVQLSRRSAKLGQQIEEIRSALQKITQ